MGAGTGTLGLELCWCSFPEPNCWILAAASDASQFLVSLIIPPPNGTCVPLHQGQPSWVSGLFSKDFSDLSFSIYSLKFFLALRLHNLGLVTETPPEKTAITS